MDGLPTSPLVREALEAATVAHAGQVRNGAGGIPYIEHPKAVAMLLAGHGFGEDVLAAALLHDVVEDSETTAAELRERFGDPVVGLVEALSDDVSIEDWRQRKTEHRERVARAGGDVLPIYAADKLTNIRALRAAWAEQGEAVASEFKVPLAYKVEAWEADLDLLRRAAPDLPFLAELGRELALFNAERESAQDRAAQA